MTPGIGETLRRLIGARPSGAAKHEAEETIAYKGYMIQPTPQKDGAQWLTAGVITKTFGEAVKEHRFVRGDLHNDRSSAVEFSISKGQQIIDLEGDRIFE